MHNEKTYDKVVVASDTHLKAHIWANRPEIANDSYWAFKSVIDYCVNNMCPLILAGDILDNNRPTSETMMFLQGELRRLIELKLPVYWISGNHDNADPAWGLMVEGVQSLDHRCAYLLSDTCFYGLNYRPAKELQEALAEVSPESKILVCHQLLDASFPQDGIHNMKMEWVPGHIKLVVLGDNHACVEYKDPRGIRFMYNGSTCMQSLAEHPAKKFTVVSLNEAGNPVFDRQPCVVRNFFDFDVRSEQDLVSALQTLMTNQNRLINTDLPEDIQVPLMRIKYSPSVAGVANRFYEIVGDSAHLWVLPHPTTNVRRGDIQLNPADEFTPAAALKALVNKDVNPDLYDFCLGLLTDDPKSVLERTRVSLGVNFAEVKKE
jgi:DNA repair exonuclease SbcCD nuclease subunit